VTRRRTSALLVASTLGLAAIPSGQVQSASAPAFPLRLVLAAAPQARFAGCYLALDRGIYRRHGLDVMIESGGAGHDRLRSLREGRADVAVLDLSEALLARAAGLPLACAGQIVNRSNLAIVAWKDRGISKLADLDGRRMSVRDRFLPACRALVTGSNVRPVIVPQHDTLNLFLLRGVEACSVLGYDEQHLLYQAGVDASQLSCFRLAEAGIDFPEDGLYALASNKGRLATAARGLLAATLEGWQHAADHPDEALAAVMRRVQEAGVLTNRTHMRWMLEQIIPSILPETSGTWQPGVLSRRSYQAACDWLIRLELLQQAPPYEEFVW
jgi:NitT/TauT family transport system substrate-binding protein